LRETIYAMGLKRLWELYVAKGGRGISEGTDEVIDLMRRAGFTDDTVAEYMRLAEVMSMEAVRRRANEIRKKLEASPARLVDATRHHHLPSNKNGNGRGALRRPAMT
jgi:hypothetical protein